MFLSIIRQGINKKKEIQTHKFHEISLLRLWIIYAATHKLLLCYPYDDVSYIIDQLKQKQKKHKFVYV